mgnify:FL=1
MYGRGMLGGFDRDAMPGRKGRVVLSLWCSRSLLTLVCRETKQKGAIDERHWSDKKLSEMKERDWRIFREDFSIAARGASCLTPFSL